MFLIIFKQVQMVPMNMKKIKSLWGGLEVVPAWSHKPNDVGSTPTPATNMQAFFDINKGKFMETMYFVLGMLSIIAAAIVSVLVWGIVKITRQQQRLDNIQRMIDEAPRESNERFNVLYRDLDDRTSWIHRRIDEYDANINRRIDETHSYIDSRVDKALGTTGAKQVIKG